MSNRIDWVDTGKFICIMFVMLSHLESRTELLRSFYTPFFLTVFFFLSGYVYRPPASFGQHFLKKLRGLFIPWLIFSHLNILLSAVITLKGDRNTLSELFWNELQIRGQGDGLWFVAALFMAFMPFYFVIRWNKLVAACVASAILSVISVMYCRLMDPALLPWNSVNLPWHLEYIFQAVLWMVLGYYFRLYGEKIWNRYHNTWTCLAVWAAYLMAVYLPFGTGGGITKYLFPICRVCWA